ncbi:probable RNA methyltransferase Y17G7B.18 isoform X2 [Cylas formicarius]|uniref:probable RNA methyltransferase Y17G7B.18 isoform X2 n=1 Tax=Cylas formicarius TaxID=197179 RepID=UPI0029587CDD|nr:probable RNA methyltransferase Y17G7B.18 isoform X2 [Cylas formicarius]
MSTIEVLEPAAVKLEVKDEVKVQLPNSKNCPNKFGGNHSKRKNKHDRSSRKRSKSFSGCGILMNAKPVLPTKFLLGGNINDPLNLNSLQDEEINRAMNAVTPKSSPVPTPPRRKMPIDVIIPPNMPDPLHLIDCENDEEYEQQLCSPVKKGRKKRLKKRRTISASTECLDADASGNSEARTPEASTDSAKIPEDPVCADVRPKTCRNLLINLGKDKKERPKRKSEEGPHPVKKFKNSMDKIVSPVIPQPGAWPKRSNSVKWAKPRQNKIRDEQMPIFKEKNKKFQYGNYDRYYGYRNPNNEVDHRLRVFSHHPYLFENKDILDIGCNIGHVTLSVARDFGARNITGIDIDPRLINIARKNVKHYVKTSENSPNNTPEAKNTQIKSSRFHDTHKGRGFPNNVTFKQCNYVLEDEGLLALEQPQFDVILCLSITKWIHLNWGDNGLKLCFRRMYEQLRPGGKLILEPQNWASYKSKKKLTEVIYKNYNTIEFFPDKFREYLLSPAVGFAKSEILGYPQHKTAGFRRSIQVFTKSTMFPSERATPSNPTNSGSYRGFTDKYESQNSELNIEHVYTNMLEGRYCECSDDTNEINKQICENLNEEAKIMDLKCGLGDRTEGTSNLSKIEVSQSSQNRLMDNT